MPRNTIKFALRMAPETQQLVKEWFPKDNCQTQNEYIEKAIRFYTGYLSGQDATAFLPVALVAALRGVVQNSESRRLILKLGVVLDMMRMFLALGVDIDPKELERIRGQCVQEVKKTNGSISFKDAVEQVG